MLGAFGVDAAERSTPAYDDAADALPATLRRDAPTTSPTRSSTTHRSETQMLRYLRRLSARDYALDRGMIPLGSCTMKLNATTEMEPVSLAGFADLHPFAPAEDATGLSAARRRPRGLARRGHRLRPGLDPAQRRLAGRAGRAAGDPRLPPGQRRASDRDVCLIPSSAHGTNAASAVMAGMRVVVVKATEDGSVDLDDLRASARSTPTTWPAIMVTYPSTHGVYEDTITELCDLVHDARRPGLRRRRQPQRAAGASPSPAEFGGDVSHLNLHKTFCIPHGGGGPGVGPVAVRAHLAPYLPTHPLHPDPAKRDGIGPIWRRRTARPASCRSRGPTSG